MLDNEEMTPSGEIVKENNLGMGILPSVNHSFVIMSPPMKKEPILIQGEGDQASMDRTEGDAMEFMSFDDGTSVVRS